MQRYVCVRIPRMDDVNLALFDYDRYNTLYFFILNADEQIYLRYGGRDSASQDTYLNLESLERALEKGLELHEAYRAGKLAPKPLPKPLFPREIPLLVERTFARNNCVECHLIGDFQNQHLELEGKLDKVTHMFRPPDIKKIGIFLDVPRGLIVKEATGPAAAGGLRAGDRIAKLNDTVVWTFGDLQYYYDQIPRRERSITLTVERDGRLVTVPIQLPPRWWLTDIRYKQLTVDPRVYFESQPLTEQEKAQWNLPKEGFASRVTYVSSFAATLKSHELRPGDIITAVDGVETDEFADTADLYIRLRKKAGEEARLSVLRDGQPSMMTLKTFRMSFRK